MREDGKTCDESDGTVANINVVNNVQNLYARPACGPKLVVSFFYLKCLLYMANIKMQG